MSALLAAAGDVHHAVAGYALPDEDDPIASVLAELRIAPLRTSPGPNAAEHVLLAHARRLHTEHRCRDFAVCSADRAFAELAELGRLELVVFTGQPISTRLSDAAHQVREVERPTTDPVASLIEHVSPPADTVSRPAAPACPAVASDHLPRTLITAVVPGFGFAAGARLADRILGRKI
ncbi:NYN domain-containing protein [Nocardia sp. NRRL S-836]|uniref:NYN domain-containing protein n=1 Tax=Nocardia sp. NRRL S-836 TaxID=1519492 RepID=UPI0006B031AD|nr:NYN domain-containing protein [Nocardia sp. NRRL S-836]KOV83104.1 hypothetical protein ADL03_21235 [Nocardia sp. NRRL S-836]